jgi:uncharacterized protein (DUF697 family)
MALKVPNQINTLLRLWNAVKGMFGDDLLKRQNLPISIALVGSEANREAASRWLGIDESYLVNSESSGSNNLQKDFLSLDLSKHDNLSDDQLKALTLDMIQKNKRYRVALATKSETLRPIITDLIAQEWAQVNAKRAIVDALPGVVPGLDFLLPFTGAGDMVALTRNQIEMVLEIAACHGLAPDPKKRLSELLPVIGSAFGWRALARQLLTVVPFGGGAVVSGVLAYTGTLAVGKAADYYYVSGGKSLDLNKTVMGLIGDAIRKVRSLIPQTKEAQKPENEMKLLPAPEHVEGV